MSETQEKASATHDPFEPFRAMRDTYLDAMAKAMVEAVNTEAYAQATGSMLEGYLTAVAPFREAVDKSMLQVLQQLELPSRQEMATLAERFTNVEMRLDDMDAKLDSIEKMLHRDGPVGEPAHGKQIDAAEPAAGRKAGTKASGSRPQARRRLVRGRVNRRQR